MGRNDKSARSFYHALAALVFAAACAWSLAALYTRLGEDEAAAAARVQEEKPVQLKAAGSFRGILLRDEQRLPVGAFPGTKAGTRLSADDTGTQSALFFPDSDGWENLCPGDAEELTPARLEALLEAETPAAQEAPRLVYGFTLTCAALFEGDPTPAPGPCSMTVDSVEETIGAELLSVTADAMGRRMLLLRLTEFPETLYEMRMVTGTLEE